MMRRPCRDGSVSRLFQFLIDGLRVALLRAPRTEASIAHAGIFMSLVAIYLFTSLLIGFYDTLPPWQVSGSGVLTVLCDALLTLVAAWLLATLARRDDALWGIASTLLAATIAVAVVVHWPLAHAVAALAAHEHGGLAVLLELLSRAWWFFVVLVFAHWLAPRSLAHAVGSAALAYAVSAAAWWWLPGAALVEQATLSLPTAQTADTGDDQGDDAKPGSTTGGEDVPTFDAEAAMYAQPALLDAALAKLRPQTPGKVDLYVVAFAGDAQEGVFRNEAEYVEALFSRRFGAEGRTVVLENSAATVTERPLATWTNLQRSLAAVARRMDPAEDVLLLYFTSHGSDDHQLLVDLDPLPLNQIGPDDILDAMKTAPAMRWKVVIVNACYSGGFVDALRDDSTMVLTSARADRTSFGCGADSDITWFGKAFLVEALNQTMSLREAFDRARTSIDAWETRDGEEHSEPQIATSRSIEARLSTWQQTLSAAPPVPFEPVARDDDRHAEEERPPAATVPATTARTD